MHQDRVVDPLAPRRELRVADLCGGARLRDRRGEVRGIVLTGARPELVAALVSQDLVERTTSPSLRPVHRRHGA